MPDQRFDASVVGTGVVGLATALGLAQQGLRVALIGPRPRPGTTTDAQPFDARIYALAPAAASQLDRLGTWARLRRERTVAVTRMRVFGDGGDELTFDAYGAAVERLATIVEEAELVRVLDAACDFQPTLSRLETGFGSFAREGDDLLLRLDTGVCRTGLLVGADGAHSAVRAAAGISADVKPYEQTALVANFDCERPHLGTAWQWFTDEGVVALLPLPGNRVSLVWSAPDRRAESLRALDRVQFAACVTARSHHSLGALSPISAAHAFPLRLIRVRRAVAPQVALVGDAAHVVHPLAGQGLNLGLQDVGALLDSIATREAFRAPGDPMVLRRYERARAESVGLMRLTTDGLAQLFAIDDPLLRRVRNGGMALVNRIKPLKSRLIRQALG
jgi:ubiquinone biosynthesis UbiH/UbiF/VisC/COQ6 family hydroxylase